MIKVEDILRGVRKGVRDLGGDTYNPNSKDINFLLLSVFGEDYPLLCRDSGDAEEEYVVCIGKQLFSEEYKSVRDRLGTVIVVSDITTVPGEVVIKFDSWEEVVSYFES